MDKIELPNQRGQHNFRQVTFDQTNSSLHETQNSYQSSDKEFTFNPNKS